MITIKDEELGEKMRATYLSACGYDTSTAPPWMGLSEAGRKAWCASARFAYELGASGAVKAVTGGAKDNG